MNTALAAVDAAIHELETGFDTEYRDELLRIMHAAAEWEYEFHSERDMAGLIPIRGPLKVDPLGVAIRNLAERIIGGE